MNLPRNKTEVGKLKVDELKNLLISIGYDRSVISLMKRPDLIAFYVENVLYKMVTPTTPQRQMTPIVTTVVKQLTDSDTLKFVLDNYVGLDEFEKTLKDRAYLTSCFYRLRMCGCSDNTFESLQTILRNMLETNNTCLVPFLMYTLSTQNDEYTNAIRETFNIKSSIKHPMLALYEILNANNIL